MKKRKIFINIIAIMMSIVVSFLRIDPQIKYALIFTIIMIQAYKQNPSEKEENKYYDLYYMEAGVIFIIESLDIMISSIYYTFDKIILLSINLIDFSVLCVISTYFSYKIVSIKRERIEKKRTEIN